MVRLLALDYRWHRLVDEDVVDSKAEIARMTGLTSESGAAYGLEAVVPGDESVAGSCEW